MKRAGCREATGVVRAGDFGPDSCRFQFLWFGAVPRNRLFTRGLSVVGGDVFAAERALRKEKHHRPTEERVV